MSSELSFGWQIINFYISSFTSLKVTFFGFAGIGPTLFNYFTFDRVLDVDPFMFQIYLLSLVACLRFGFLKELACFVESCFECALSDSDVGFFFPVVFSRDCSLVNLVLYAGQRAIA